MRPRPRHPVVHKFGGAALKDAASIQRAMQILTQQPTPHIVVVSAVAGMTDLLIGLASEVATRTAGDASRVFDQIVARHREIVTALDLSGNTRLMTFIDAAEAELRALKQACERSGVVTPAQRDQFLSHGERVSAALVSATLSAMGIVAEQVDPARLIITAGPHGDAIPDQAATRIAVQQHLTPLLLQEKTPVVAGFLGRAPDGGIATLGRGGTDLTATLLARATDGDHLVLWKDVPGFMTADPRAVPDARVLESVHRLEAAELAWFGAKLLHPRALAPLMGTRIELHLKNFGDPDAPGTVVTAQHNPSSTPVRAIAAVTEQTLLTVSGNGVLGVPGIVATVFAALHAMEIPVSMIAQASAEAALDFTVPSRRAAEAVTTLREALREDIQRGEIDGVERRDQMAVVAVVGLNMARHTGVAAKVFDALADARINIVAIAQGAGERNITMALEEHDASAALRHIHDAFQLGKLGGGRPLRRTGRDVILLGAGTIGRTVLRLMAQHPECFQKLRIVAVIDSRGARILPQGFSVEELTEMVATKVNGNSLAEMRDGKAGVPLQILQELIGHALVRPMVADMTATDTGPMLRLAADAGWDLVLANKRPLAAPTAEMDKLHHALRQRHAHIRYEATVGAGLPVVEALQQLLATGDRVQRLEGCLSGTLGVVLSALEDGVPFSEAVFDARRRGFTEPDPRDDLGGVDVARKALILARTLGVRHELQQIQIDSLVLRGADLDTDAWLQELPLDDANWAARVSSARARSMVLRYVATITPESVEVGLRELPMTHPLAQLRGAANQLVYTSDRYHDSPLVITGPGAGPEVTATGVLADLLALAG